MKTWFTSLNGAMTLSVVALLTELWRAFVDFQHQFYLPSPLARWSLIALRRVSNFGS